MSHVKIIILEHNRSQICKVLCAATGQEPHEEAGGGRSTNPPAHHKVFHLYLNKHVCRPDSALKCMKMGYILPPPSTAAAQGVTAGLQKKNKKTKIDR